MWASKKRKRIEESGIGGDWGSSSGENTAEVGPYIKGALVEDQPMIDAAGNDAHQLQPSGDSAPEVTPDSLADDIEHQGRPRRPDRQVPKRIRDIFPQIPKRFRDILPQPLPPLPLEAVSNQPSTSPLPPTSSPPPPSPPVMPPSSPPNPTLMIGPLVSRIRQLFRTPRNVFGLFRQYHSDKLPSHDPEEFIDLQDLSESPAVVDPAFSHAENVFYPYPNENSYLLGDWYWSNGSQKSHKSFSRLLSIVGNPNFRPEDVRRTRWNKVDAALAHNDFDEIPMDDSRPEWMDDDAGWKRTPISISVPFHSRARTPGPQEYIAGDLYHRPLVSVIREKLSQPQDDQHFHYEPFELFWQPTDTSAEVRVHGELYTSPAFLDAHRELQDAPGEPGCDLPKVIVAMMFWSDETHLTSFGDAKLWPSYLFFGNESKYRRCKPTSHLCNHVAYFQALPDAFKDFATEYMGGKGPSNALMTHCRREVIQAQWAIMLDDEFVEAWEHGIVHNCCDKVKRRFYPRIFIYSADYKEKVLIASIRDMGNRPCPRCLIPLSRVQNLGTVLDKKHRKTMARVDDDKRRRNITTAREIIYEKNYAVDNEHVEVILKEQSLVPTVNAFSQRLATLGFCFYSMLVVDLMHEFELGVWKNLFIHLLRILLAVDKKLIHDLDRRFRQLPTFGRDTIRRFSKNVSELKKMAARDFEDMLQCAIPVFEGLLPEPYNSAILRLLFTCAHWHALAKLRMHIDHTLNFLDNATTLLGTEFRKFANKTCPAFNTRELKRESDARKRRLSKKAKVDKGPSDPAPDPPATESDEGPRQKTFSLQTYKFHALGDYVDAIRRYGTTDSFSTEPGELEHRTPKARYARTDKKSFVRQLTQIERRETRLRRIRERLAKQGQSQAEPAPNSMEQHHHIGLSQNQYEHIGSFLHAHDGDPAVQNFLPKLKQHLLPRILSSMRSENEATPHPLASSGSEAIDPGDCDRNSVLFNYDRIYRHNLMRINYTTYDVRRSQDVVNPSTSHCNIMVLGDSQNDGDSASRHRFRYARVLGIYHANVIYVGHGMLNYQPRRMEFLWVRWYHTVDTATSGWKALKLDRVKFLPVVDDGAFGFIDPSDVLRGSYIVPAFASGKRWMTRAREEVSLCAQNSSDYVQYYVNRFVDRDMVMRYYYGLGVGHTYAHVQTPGEPPSTSQCDVEQVEGEMNVLHGSDGDSQEPFENFLGEHDSESECSYLSDLDGDECWEDEDDSFLDPSDDEEFYEMEMMYGGSNER